MENIGKPIALENVMMEVSLKIKQIFYRPGVAGAVLQTPSSLIH